MEEALANFPYWNPKYILAVAGPFFFITVMLEWWGIKSGRLGGGYETKDAWASMAMGFGNLLSDIVTGFISVAWLLWIWELPFRTLDWGFSIGALIAAVIAQDFLYYWKHFAYHKIRWFWSAHVVHHSSEHYNLSTALRQPWNNHIIGLALLSTPLVFLGLHPLLLAFVAAFNLIYQYWIHTEAIGKMPRWFEAVMNTPSHHRVHHGTNPRYLDANFAGIFIIWDKMFGTFVPEIDDEKVAYGIIKPVGTFNPVKIAFIEFINLFKDVFRPGLKLSERLKYAFKAPGYSHDGSRIGSMDIKRAYVAEHPDQAGTPGLPEQG
ncbi:MAG: sterol desaturase family protein [Hellea sp.]|nr:sterol desaturase family protein [Hellea sp.]